MSQGAPVQLYVYDLSQGMARQMSMALLGRQLEGIWHTSVVVWGTEFYFGAGIQRSSTPGLTEYGRPVAIHDMGVTLVSRTQLEDFLTTLSGQFTHVMNMNVRTTYIDAQTVCLSSADTYHLLDNNCNDFSNTLCRFLVQKSIPEHITALPADFGSTPLGQSLRPLIDSMFSGQAKRSASALNPSQAVPIANEADLISVLRDQPRVLICFHGSDPDLHSFEAALAECNHIPRGAWRGRVESDRAFMPYSAKVVQSGKDVWTGVSHRYFAQPALIAFVSGTEHSRSEGSVSRDFIAAFVKSQYPVHRHASVTLQSLRTLTALDPATTQYTASKVDLVVKKLKSHLQEQGVGQDRSVGEALVGLVNHLQAHQAPFRNEWFDVLTVQLPVDKSFPVFDIMRLLAADTQSRPVFEKHWEWLFQCFKIYAIAKLAHEARVPRSTVLMVMRILCNLMSTADSCASLLALSHQLALGTDDSSRVPAWKLVVEIILSHLLPSSEFYSSEYVADRGIREAVVSLLYNIAALSLRERLYHHGMVAESPRSDEEDEMLIELFPAICHAFANVDHGNEDYDLFHPLKDEESCFRLVATLMWMLYFASETMEELALVLDVQSILQTLTRICPTRFNLMLQDIRLLIAPAK